MPGLLSSMTLNQKLASAAFVLGAVAIFARPAPGGAVTLDAGALAAIVQRDADAIAPLDLADWIVQGRSDFRLVDVRDAQAFATYHIPGAENVALPALADAALPRNEKVIVYGADGTKAAQAWFLLKARGHVAAYLLRDGLEGWQQEVLFPTVGEAATPFQQQRNARLASVSAHFGGAPRTASGEGAALPAIATPAMPAPVAAPVAPAGGPVGAPKKKREGC